LPHGTNKQKKSNGIKTKNKNRDAQKKQSIHKVRGVSSEAERESMVGNICEGGRFRAGSERQRELLMVRVVRDGELRCGGRRNRQVIDRENRMRLMERTRELIPETR